MTLPPWIRPTGDDEAEIDLLVVPRASRSRPVGEHDGRLRFQVAAPPVDGAANEALIEALASHLSLRRGAFTLVSGQTGRRKTVRVEGMPASKAVSMLLG